MTDADKARAIQEQAGRLAAVLEKPGALDKYGNWTKSAQFEYLQLCNAIIDLIDDGDALASREVMMEELGCDENGDPVPDEDGELSSYDRRAILNPIYTGGGKL